MLARWPTVDGLLRLLVSRPRHRGWPAHPRRRRVRTGSNAPRGCAPQPTRLRHALQSVGLVLLFPRVVQDAPRAASMGVGQRHVLRGSCSLMAIVRATRCSCHGVCGAIRQLISARRLVRPRRGGRRCGLGRGRRKLPWAVRRGSRDGRVEGKPGGVQQRDLPLGLLVGDRHLVLRPGGVVIRAGSGIRQWPL